MPLRLDENQNRAANHNRGHLLILAGAGSGKTTVVTARAARRVLRDGVDTRRILLLTFTNKAAREMRERLTGLLHEVDDTLPVPLVSTFHAFGHRLIRRHPETFFRAGRPSLMNQDDQESALRDFLKDADISQIQMREAQALCDEVRNRGLSLLRAGHFDQARALLERKARGDDLDPESLLYAMKKYEAYKEQHNLLDFDDLLCLPIRGLLENPGLQSGLRRFLTDITVDEAQDNNHAQYTLLKLISGENVVMVGDDDQAIYEWRGACPANMQAFIEDFSPEIVRLERNYRSMPAIVDHATAVVRNNRDRLEKNPYAIRESSGQPIRLDQHRNGERMAREIARQIREEIDRGANPSDIAVLYRVNRMAGLLEGELLKQGIPYQIKAGTELMERAETRMLLAAGRLAVNPTDAPAFLRLTQVVTGLGPKKAQAMIEAGGREGPLTAIDQAAPRSRPALERLASEIRRLYERGPLYLLHFARDNLREWMHQTAERAIKARNKDVESEALEALRNQRVAQMVNRCRMVVEAIRHRIEGLDEDADIDDLWAEALDMALAPPESEQSAETETREAVMLSSGHGAKGLEWNTVHLAGFSEGLVPLHNSDGEVENPSEERRLAYVMMTRARDRLVLHHCDEIDMKIGKGAMRMTPSRFIREAETVAPLPGCAGDEDFVARPALFGGMRG